MFYCIAICQLNSDLNLYRLVLKENAVFTQIRLFVSIYVNRISSDLDLYRVLLTENAVFTQIRVCHQHKASRTSALSLRPATALSHRPLTPHPPSSRPCLPCPLPSLSDRQLSAPGRSHHTPPLHGHAFRALCLLSPTGHRSQLPCTAVRALAAHTTPPPSLRPTLPGLCLVSLTGHSSQPPATHTTHPPLHEQASQPSAFSLRPATALSHRPHPPLHKRSSRASALSLRPATALSHWPLSVLTLALHLPLDFLFSA